MDESSLFSGLRGEAILYALPQTPHTFTGEIAFCPFTGFAADRVSGPDWCAHASASLELLTRAACCVPAFTNSSRGREMVSSPSRFEF